MENKKYTIGQLTAMKSEELAQYDCWIIRKIRTGEEVPEEVPEEEVEEATIP